MLQDGKPEWEARSSVLIPTSSKLKSEMEIYITPSQKTVRGSKGRYCVLASNNDTDGAVFPLGPLLDITRSDLHNLQSVLCSRSFKIKSEELVKERLIGYRYSVNQVRDGVIPE